MKVYILSEVSYFGGDGLTFFRSKAFSTKDKALDMLDELTNWDKPYSEDFSDPKNEIYEFVSPTGRSYFFSITEAFVD